jgi:putative transposase
VYSRETGQFSLNKQKEIAIKKSKFTGAQIVFALKQSGTGVAVAEVCRMMGISEAAFYWKEKVWRPGCSGTAYIAG